MKAQHFCGILLLSPTCYLPEAASGSINDPLPLVPLSVSPTPGSGVCSIL